MAAVTPITQRDVAIACGLHPSTVCLALKNAPSIPEATRQRIQAVAAQLGYQPNVAARNLALLRTEKKSGSVLPIAWINQEARRDYWRVDDEARAYFETARQRAGELGYHLEEIWAREPGMNAARLTQIVRARGIEGVIFPALRGCDFSLLQGDWSDFSLVGLNDHRLGEWVDVVCPDYYGNTATTLRRVRQLGFGRVGLALSAQFDAASNGLVHACYLRHQAELAVRGRLPVCFTPNDAVSAAAVMEDWLHEWRPDVVLCSDATMGDAAGAQAGGARFVLVHGNGEAFDAVFDPAPADISRTAVDAIVDKMRRFERGARECTSARVIKGLWQERALGVREAATVVA